MLGVVAARGRQEAGGVAPLPRGTEVPCPAGSRLLPAGAQLQVVLNTAARGAVLCLSPGQYAGPVEIRTHLTLQGPADAVIRSNDTGTTVRVLTDSVVLRGFSVDGSGRRYDKMDAAVYLRGDGIVVRDLKMRNALFGIIAERSNDVTISGNEIVGLADLPVGTRGDGIRLWEVRRSQVVGNHLEDSRDILVWYSPGNRFVGNTVLRSRYATHFMYSDDCVVQDAEYRENIVGVFIMYSRGDTLRHNSIIDNAAAAGMGVGVKESGDLVIVGNRFVHDHDCLYLDNSPFRAGDSVLVRDDVLARCDAAVTFHSSEHGSAFLDNVFQGNQTQVTVEGRGTATGVTWRQNYFDDYKGYDLNGDGIGDVAYELRDLSERLVSNHPQLAFFRGTVAFGLLDLAAQAFPVLQPETMLVDPSPRMAPPGNLRRGGERD